MGTPLKDQLAIMSEGDAIKKFTLMNEHIERMVEGEILDPAEVAVLEYLKNWAAENVVPVYMAATVQGQGGM